jgi:hypothetical protein
VTDDGLQGEAGLLVLLTAAARDECEQRDDPDAV